MKNESTIYNVGYSTTMDRMYDDFHGLWRGSAMEKHPYTEDFPEPLLVSPELYDGCIGHGKASNIWIEYDFTKTPAHTRVRDDGQGVRNETRLLTWAASTSQSTEHRNGHGHKKALTKFAPDYETAKWSIQYRKSGGNLILLKGPFLGNRTSKIEDEDNTTTLMPSGTETYIEFDKTVLGRFSNPPRVGREHPLAKGLKELIRSRYSEAILRRVTFHIDIHWLNAEGERVHDNLNSRTEDWHSFRWHVETGVTAGYIRQLCVNQEYTSAGAPWNLSVFKIVPRGTHKFDLKEEFPTYGKKNQYTQRLYIALQERMIEAAHLYPFLDRLAPHNDDNGLIVFADFTSHQLERQLTPSTTKVSIFPAGEIYNQFVADLKAGLKGAIAAAAETDESSGSDASPARPTPVARVERSVLVATDLGVSFHMKNGQMLVDPHDGTGMRPLRDYELKLKTNKASDTA